MGGLRPPLTFHIKKKLAIKSVPPLSAIFSRGNNAMNSAETTFTLSKWYLDCVAENGDVFIGYYLSMRYKKLRLNYSAVLSCIDNKVKQQGSNVPGKYSPHKEETLIEWHCPLLNIDGKWVSKSSPIDRTLLESPEGNIQWQCYQPGSLVQIKRDGLQPFVGLGYVERLEMNIPSWKLPIDELRWGRLVCENNHVVWIEWRGSYPQVLIYHNGVVVAGGLVSGESIETQDGLKIELENHFTLRKGKIGSSALGSLMALTSIAPLKLLKVHEHRLRSRGTLKKNGSVLDRGWAIHEVVRF